MMLSRTRGMQMVASFQANPQQLAMMDKVVAGYCATYGVAVGTPDHLALTRRVMSLFGAGVSDPARMKTMLAP